jgi:hypothetical protein
MRRVRCILLAAASATILAGTVAPLGSAAAAPVIQPGSSLDFDGSFCTANWVYSGGGATYIGAAGHCTTGVGQVVDLSTASLGSPIERIGTVAYIGSGLDYCLIKLDSGVLGQVRVNMAGHPKIPTGVATPANVHAGDLVRFSGHGVGFDSTKVTQQQRVGVFNFFSGGNQYVIAPISPGDSGGPVADVTDGNRALGIVDTVGVNVVFPHASVGEGGVALYALLADARAHGFAISLRVV